MSADFSFALAIGLDPIISLWSDSVGRSGADEPLAREHVHLDDVHDHLRLCERVRDADGNLFVVLWPTGNSAMDDMYCSIRDSEWWESEWACDSALFVHHDVHAYSPDVATRIITRAWLRHNRRDESEEDDDKEYEFVTSEDYRTTSDVASRLDELGGLVFVPDANAR